MRFNVGDLLYLLSSDKKHLFPVQVVEEIRRRTIEEEDISYNIQLPDAKKTVVSLSDVKGDVFRDLVDARQDMLDHAILLIDKIVEQTSVLTESFGIVEKNPEVLDVEEEDNILSDNQGIVEVDLGNGVMGKVNISEIGA